MGLLTGKRALIVGIASKLSIAHGIAEAFHREGAELALTYQNEKLRKRVTDFGAHWKCQNIFPLDVQNDTEISGLFEQLTHIWPDGIDIIVHSVGFAPAEELNGNYIDVTTREGFHIAQDISCFSFTALAKAGRELLNKRQGNLLTLTYQGSERVVPNYNVMGLAKASLEANVKYLAHSMGPEGVRVNAISAGPIRTLAASGIKQFRTLLKFNEEIVPLRRNIDTQEVGNAAVFLCSDYASGKTGEILYGDAGLHALGMTAGILPHHSNTPSTPNTPPIKT